MMSQQRMPAEWEPHRALWVGWPRLPEEWDGQIDAAREEIAAFVRRASPHTPIRIAVGDEAAAVAAKDHGLPRYAEIIRIPTGDIWLRDTGPVFTLGADGDPMAHLFAFNGWGNKFLMEGDEATAAAIARHEDLVSHHHDIVLEGGAIETDGSGTFLTTRSCLLNANRNDAPETAQVEGWLGRLLGARQTLWLKEGLLGDHTDGHIDNIARFVAPGHIVCQHAGGSDDPHKDRLTNIEAELRATGLKVSTLPSPGRVENHHGKVLPASHLNYVITNGLILVPSFDADRADEASTVLQSLFPSHTAAALPARAILSGGGTFHCMTTHVPAEMKR
ncbi:MAG: agmatine deiminase family protein [Parvularcula sp.]